MRLLVDIGNTNTSIAVVKGKKIIKRYFVHTSKKKGEISSLKRLLRVHIDKIDDILVVSVVPKFLKIIKESLKKIFPSAVLVVIGKDKKVPIVNRYEKPLQVGQDRLVTAFAAVKKYGGPLLIIDFGTAVTFDFVNKKGQYEGGLIFPGMKLGLSALTRNAALLPKTTLRPIRGLIGRNTRDSINKGVLLGYASLCDGMIERVREKYGETLKIVVTGGDSILIRPYSVHIKTIDKDLIFFGLCQI